MKSKYRITTLSTGNRSSCVFFEKGKKSVLMGLAYKGEAVSELLDKAMLLLRWDGIKAERFRFDYSCLHEFLMEIPHGDRVLREYPLNIRRAS